MKKDKKNKSFWEIKKSLFELQSSVWKDSLKTELSSQVLWKLLDEKDWLEIVSKDRLESLNSLLPIWLEIKFNNFSNNIFIWDKIFVKDYNKLVLRTTFWKEKVIWELIWFDKEKIFSSETNSSLFARKYIEYKNPSSITYNFDKLKNNSWIDTNYNWKNIIKWNLKDIYNSVLSKEKNFDDFLNEIKVSPKEYNSFDVVAKWLNGKWNEKSNYFRVIFSLNEKWDFLITDSYFHYINRKSPSSLEEWKSFYKNSKNASFKLISKFYDDNLLFTPKKDLPTKNKKLLDLVQRYNVWEEKPKQKEEEKKKELITDNPTIKAVFEEFYSKYQIPFLQKEELLNLSEWNYYVATAMIMTHLMEQWNWWDINFRWILKDIARNKDNIELDTIPILGLPLEVVIQQLPDLRSRWEFQIRYWKNNLSKNDIKELFSEYNKGKYNKLNFVKQKDKILLDELYSKFQTSQDLKDSDRIKLLDNQSINTIIASIYLKNRFSTTKNTFENFYKIDLWERLNNWWKDKQFVFLSTILESYHSWPSWWIKAEVIINSTLKIWEKVWMYKELNKGWKKSYQETIREETKWWITGWAEFYKRGKLLFVETANNLETFLLSNKKKILQDITNAWYEKPSEVFDKIIYWLSKIISINNINLYELSDEIKYSLNTLSKIYNVKFIEFTVDDYMNTDPNKALLIWNYWPSAWYLLNK